MKRALIAGLFGAVAFLGCSFQRPLSYQNVALGPQERPITTVKGEASADYLLGFQMDGDDTYAAAIEDAKARVGVDVGTLYNVFVDRRIVCFPFCSFAIVTNVTTSIYGTLVTYDGLKNVEPKLYSLDAMKRGEKICVVTNKGENITGTFAYVDYSLPKKLWLNTGTHTYYFGETAIGLDSIASVEEDTGDCGKTKVKEPI